MEFHDLRYQRIMLDPEVGLWEATAVNLAAFLLTHPIRSLCKGIHPTVPIPTKALWIHHQYILNTQTVVPGHHHKIRFVPVLPVVPAAITVLNIVSARLGSWLAVTDRTSLAQLVTQLQLLNIKVFFLGKKLID